MNNSQKVLSNMAWRFAERVGAQGVKLLVEIILARLLLPDDFGLIAIVTVLITILNVFVDSGLGNALIQKKDADDLDFSSVFWFNLFLCIIIYFILYNFAPIIASFYKRIELAPIIRILGLQVIISGVKNVQQAYVSRTLQFKKFFFSTLGGTLGAACVGIFLAYKGFGVWALVAQQLFNVAVDTTILWVTVKWRPKCKFSLERLKALFSFGWKLLASALIDTIYAEIRQLIIGKIYTSDSLAYYNRGDQFPKIFVGNVNNAIDSVLLPTLSQEQDDKDRLKAMTKRAIKTSVYIMAPLMMGLAFIGEPFVRLLLTEKWLPCVPFMRIFCVTYMFYPIHTANLNAIKAMGRSDLFLKLEIIKKIIGLIALLLTMNISVMAMAYSLLVTSIMNQIINSWPNKKLLNYPINEQWRDILPAIILAVCMGVCIRFFDAFGLSDIVTLSLQVIVGASFYIVGSKILRFDSYDYLLNICKGFLKKNYS